MWKFALLVSYGILTRGFDLLSLGAGSPGTKLRGDGHIKDALGNDIDMYGRWWTPRDRDVFKGNININKFQPPSVKSFTKAGFHKMEIPSELWKNIKEFHAKSKEHETNEGTVPGYIVGKTTWMSYIDGNLRNMVFETMKPILADWCGVPLAESAVYGIRKVRSYTFFAFPLLTCSLLPVHRG
jgi:hypothetical protein